MRLYGALIVSLAFILFSVPVHATLVGCDYWDRYEIEGLDERLDRARDAYFSIGKPTQTEFRAERERMWNYYKNLGYDPSRQMGDDDWLRRVYHGRVYKERIGFIPTHQEYWIYCLDTRLARGGRCESILKQNGPIDFDEHETAIDPPIGFRSLYEDNKDKFFEQKFLAAMIIDALPSCNESAETDALIDKAIRYIRER